MYAIIFEVNTSFVETLSSDEYSKINANIRFFLEKNSFIMKNYNTYFGNENISAVDCFLTIQKLTKKHIEFANLVSDIQMLRIAENCDMLKVINSVL